MSGFFPTNQNTLYLLFLFYSDNDFITVQSRPAICALIGWILGGDSTCTYYTWIILKFLFRCNLWQNKFWNSISYFFGDSVHNFLFSLFKKDYKNLYFYLSLYLNLHKSSQFPASIILIHACRTFRFRHLRDCLDLYEMFAIQNLLGIKLYSKLENIQSIT